MIQGQLGESFVQSEIKALATVSFAAASGFYVVNDYSIETKGRVNSINPGTLGPGQGKKGSSLFLTPNCMIFTSVVL
jgi:hypothetical protein